MTDADDAEHALLLGSGVGGAMGFLLMFFVAECNEAECANADCGHGRPTLVGGACACLEPVR